MKNFFTSGLLMFLAISSFSQSDFDLLVKSNSNNRTEIKEGTKFKGLLKIYNEAITDQIINDCIYQESCSNFGQHSFENYGLVKGFFITTDRLMRCNRLSQSHVLPVRFDKKGKISDPSHWYKK